MKRVSYRRQKRWWNAYLLFYTRLDVEEDNLCNSFNELSLGKCNAVYEDVDSFCMLYINWKLLIPQNNSF